MGYKSLARHSAGGGASSPVISCGFPLPDLCSMPVPIGGRIRILFMAPCESCSLHSMWKFLIRWLVDFDPSPTKLSGLTFSALTNCGCALPEPSSNFLSPCNIHIPHPEVSRLHFFLPSCSRGTFPNSYYGVRYVFFFSELSSYFPNGIQLGGASNASGRRRSISLFLR